MFYFTNQTFHAFSFPFFQKYGRLIVTLDPNKLVEKKQQCLHIGGLKSYTTHILLLGQSGVKDMRICYEMKTPTWMNVSFPLDTKAFLYYSMSPERPRIAGELRLRVTSSGDLRRIGLLRTNGLP